MSTVQREATSLRASIARARKGRYVPTRDAIEVGVYDLKRIEELAIKVDELLKRGQR